MSLKVRAVLVVVIGLVLGLSLSVGGGLIGGSKAPTKEEMAWEQARLFAEVLERVKRDYVEPLDDAELLESAIRGMVSDLDAHSQYLDAGEYRDIRISTTGSYTGIGIEIDEVDGKVLVVAPFAGSPAARSGIRSGDQIVAVDGLALDGTNLQETIGHLRGHAGSSVTVSVLRDDEVIDHEMRRQVIRMASVHREFLAPSYGYIRVSQFNENTARELRGAIDDLQNAAGSMLDGFDAWVTGRKRFQSETRLALPVVEADAVDLFFLVGRPVAVVIHVVADLGARHRGVGRTADHLDGQGAGRRRGAPGPGRRGQRG